MWILGKDQLCKVLIFINVLFCSCVTEDNSTRTKPISLFENFSIREDQWTICDGIEAYRGQERSEFIFCIKAEPAGVRRRSEITFEEIRYSRDSITEKLSKTVDIDSIGVFYGMNTMREFEYEGVEGVFLYCTVSGYPSGLDSIRLAQFSFYNGDVGVIHGLIPNPSYGNNSEINKGNTRLNFPKEVNTLLKSKWQSDLEKLVNK
jgi:hypothetical protein